MNKPYAESCDQNGQSILEVLKPRLPKQGKLLEIGSGTGQHAVMFAPYFPLLSWQTSDVIDNHSGIQMWLDETGRSNLIPPIALDVMTDPWPTCRYNAIYSANTSHIMSMAAVEAMFRLVSQTLISEACFFLYGPFMDNGRHTSESNARFDLWLKTGDPQRGVRDVTCLKQISKPLLLDLVDDIAMPENNRILIWQKGIAKTGEI